MSSNKDKIFEFLDYSLLASSDYPTLENCQVLDFVQCDNGVDYYIGKCKSKLIISFRGTDSFKDKLTDIRFFKKVVPYDNKKGKIKAHTGFYEAYNNKQVKQNIAKYVTKEITTIYISGHSLGAALGILCALDIQYNFSHKNIECIVFGCPRVGNKHFVKSYNKRVIKTIRVENKNDIVTKIPFKFMGYKHVGISCNLGLKIPFIFSKQDHHINSYYNSMWNKML